MLVWIIILFLWIATLSLILHDATKDDSSGSAVVLAARRSRRGIARMTRRLKKSAKPPESAKKMSPAPQLKVVKPAEIALAPSAEPAPQAEVVAQKQAPDRPRKRKWWSKDTRTEKTAAELEEMISAAVRKTPTCEDFIGVIVHHRIPKSSPEPNWEIQGAKFGKADRKLAQEALAAIVERLQQEMLLVEERKDSASRHAGARATGEVRRVHAVSNRAQQ